MRRAGGIAAIVVLLAGAFVLGFELKRVSQRPLAGGSYGLAPIPEGRLTPLDEVRRELAFGYYRGLGPDVLGRRTIPEMLEALDDPYTEYLSADEYRALNGRMARSYTGVGLTVGPARGGLVVTSSLRGPARDAGVKPGDVIVSIDGRRARGLDFERSLLLIKGEAGTLVRLTIRRPGGRVLRVIVARREIAMPALRLRMLRTHRTKLGYVRLLSFPANAADRLERATARLVDRGAKGLVVDLRDNPGGLLQQAIGTASIFLETGIVCSTEGEHQERRVYAARGDAAFPRLPLVLLVDRGSASSAEILAAALSDRGRALVVGERTFGKASVQSIRPLPNGAALKLTTATYRTPAGGRITGVGVRPDLVAPDDPLTAHDEGLVAAERVLLRRIGARLDEKARLIRLARIV